MTHQKKWSSNLTPIRSLEALASTLSTDVETLARLSTKKNDQWKPGKRLPKKDGSFRQTHDAKAELKNIHHLINLRILKQVNYPSFLFGGIQDRNNPRSPKSHAAFHAGQASIIKEDISDFFPTITPDVVHRIWMYFFHYSEEVCEILTSLTTFNGAVPQGWKTSGYIANLVFWDREFRLNQELLEKGFRYSRYVDDITVSARHRMTPDEKTWTISAIYRMLTSAGFKPNRAKHEVLDKSQPMIVTGLLANSETPRMQVARRAQTRALVQKLERLAKLKRRPSSYNREWRRVAGLVGVLRSMNPVPGEKLKQRMMLIK